MKREHEIFRYITEEMRHVFFDHVENACNMQHLKSFITLKKLKTKIE